MKETNKDTVGQYFYQMDTHVFPLLGALAIAMVVVVAVPTLGGTTEGASESYNLTVDDAVDIPDQNASINGTQTTVSSTVSVAPGLPVEANVSAPAGDTVRVLLVDTDGERYASAVVNGSGSVTAPTTGLNTGTYYLTVQNGKTIEQAQEVVISDLDVSLSRTNLNESGTLSMRVGVIPHENITFEFVEIVVTDGESKQVQPMPMLRHGLYETSMSTDELSSGEYTVYARLVTDCGENVGMSNTMNVTVSGNA